MPYRLSLIEGVVERFAMLATHPKAGRLRPDLAPALRCFPVGRYVVYYREERGMVQIARVLHGSRDQVDAEAR